jgi:glycosyltransferase involved in cell wall biosynthesis
MTKYLNEGNEIMMPKKPRVLLISPAHPSADPRIVLKIAPTLAQNHDVVCLLPTIQFPHYQQLSLRLLLVHPVILWHIVWLRPKVLHLFMPEMLPIGLVCRAFGVRVVYEVQENLRLKFDRKPRNNHRVFQWFFGQFEQLARQFCYHVFTDDSYLATYPDLQLPFATVRNFPIIPDEVFTDDAVRQENQNAKNQAVVYLGVVSFDRGLGVMVQALARLKRHYPTLKLHLIGRCHFDQEDLEVLPEFGLVRQNVVFHGHLPHAHALPIVAKCVAGLAVLQPVGDYPDSYPTKLFEYMALGLPVVVSDFGLYRAVVEPAGCGFCVNPTKPALIADALAIFLDHRDEGQRMGQAGQQAVVERYSWATEAEKLLDLYQKISL